MVVQVTDISWNEKVGGIICYLYSGGWSPVCTDRDIKTRSIQSFRRRGIESRDQDLGRVWMESVGSQRPVDLANEGPGRVVDYNDIG